MVTDSSILGFLLVTRFRRGVKKGELVRAFEVLKKEISSRDFLVCLPGEDTNRCCYPTTSLGQVDAVLALIPHLVSVSADGSSIEPVTDLEHRIELLFYANQAFHSFWGEALVLASISSTLEDFNLSSLKTSVCVSRAAVDTRFTEVGPPPLLSS